MEQQIVCFTCGYRIGPIFDRVKKYEETLYLSLQDAIDKAQIRKECCRMTIMGQSGVEERVRAAGVPQTGESGVMTVEISEGLEFPSMSMTRRPIPKPEKGEIQLATNLGQTSWAEYSAPKAGMILQGEVAHGSFFRDSSKPPIPELGPRSFRDIFVSGWDLTNLDSYPKKNWYTFIRSKDLEVYIPVAPFSNAMVKFVPKRDEQNEKSTTNTVEKLVHDLAAFTRSPNKGVYKGILKMSPTVVEHPDILIQMFNQSDDPTLSLIDVYEGKMNLLKVSKGPEVGSIVLEFDRGKNPPHYYKPKYASYISRLENFIKGFVIESVNDSETNSISLTLSKDGSVIILKLDEFDIHSEGGDSIDFLNDATVRSVVHSRKNKKEFMIVLSNGENIIVLSVLGPVSGTKDDKDLGLVYPF